MDLKRAPVAFAVDVGGDHGRHLRWAGVEEAQALLDIFRRAQAEQRAAGADGQQVAEGVACVGDIGRRRLDVRVAQQWLDQCVVLAVVGGGGRPVP
jgi:hypothetical protein